MEIYNQLIREFHDTRTYQPQLLQLKSISDQLFKCRAAKKLHYLNKKQELKQISQQNDENLTQSRMSVSFRCTTSRTSFRSLDSQRQDLVEMDKEELKKKIGQLEKQIAVLKDKTQVINGQLDLFAKRQDEVDVVNKRSELEVFNSVQILYLQASKQNQEEVNEQHILRQLQSKRQHLTQQISQLCQSLKHSQQMLKKWQESKKLKIQTSKYIRTPIDNFKEIAVTMLQIDQLWAESQKDQKKKEEKEKFIEELSEIGGKCQVITLLEGLPFKLDKQFSNRIISFYKRLQNQFDRNERANKQINSYLQTLYVKNDELTEILDKNNKHTQKRTKQTLKKRQYNLKELEQALNKKCKLITNFTNKFYFLLKRMQSLKKTLNDILTRQNSQNGDGESAIVSYDEKLNKNLEDYNVRWTQSTGIQSTFYQEYIQPNDMLRLFSCPESYNSGVDNLTNYQMFMTGGFRCIHDYSKKMIKQSLQFFNFCKRTKQKSSKNIHKIQDSQFCVQSMDYYRRDNYKLLQKMQKNELKKKGLLVQIPFNVCVDEQLLEKREDKKRKLIESVSTPRTTDRNRKYMKYTELATKREERSLKSSGFRHLFSRLDSLKSRSSSRLLNLSSLQQSRSTLNTSKEWPKNSLKRISLPRNTIGTLRKQNSQYH